MRIRLTTQHFARIPCRPQPSGSAPGMPVPHKKCVVDSSADVRICLPGPWRTGYHKTQMRRVVLHDFVKR